MQSSSLGVYDGADASRWPSCECSCPAFGPQAPSGWRLIRRPVREQPVVGVVSGGDVTLGQGLHPGGSAAEYGIHLPSVLRN